MAVAFIESVLKAKPCRDTFVTFFGGEPTTNPALIHHVTDYVHRIRDDYPQTQIHLCLTTNGTMTSTLLYYCLQNRFQFSVSMDGLPWIQDAGRPLKNGQPSSKIVERNLREIVSRGSDLRVRLTVTAASAPFLAESVAYLASLGVKVIHPEAVTIAGRASDETACVTRPTPEAFSRNLVEALNLARDLGVSLVCTAYGKVAFPSRFMCDGVTGNRIAIAPSGFVSGCLEVQTAEHELAESMRLGYTLMGRRRVDLCGAINEAAVKICEPLDECSSCFAAHSCSSGCPSRNFHTTGKTNWLDPFHCRITKDALNYFMTRCAEETRLQGLFRRLPSGRLYSIVYPPECVTARPGSLNWRVLASRPLTRPTAPA
jgi:uncharacterized protein